ncbi:MAG: class I SAM-dependent methyltransferase [Candidatus Promineifilaceae bacterium]
MTIDPAVFDAFAPTYDNDFTQTRLGQMLRRRVWQTLERYFTPGQHLLELACGTGEDARWLAQHGIHVTATDGSAEMVQTTRRKAQQAGLEQFITIQQRSLQEFTADFQPQTPLYDGLFSNFGGLNTTGDWRPLAQSLAQLVKPGGKAVLVPMGPVCPWETGWYLLHGRFSEAFRRFKKVSQAKIGSATIPIWYPSARQLRAAFAPWFRHLETRSLGFWLPPSYLDHLVNRWPNLFARLNRFESATARLTSGWGDHYILCLERLSNG